MVPLILAGIEREQGFNLLDLNSHIFELCQELGDACGVVDCRAAGGLPPPATPCCC